MDTRTNEICMINSMEKNNRIPFGLVASHPNHWQLSDPDESISARALPQSDLYCNPKNGFAADAASVLNALTLSGLPEGKDLQISARVAVDFNSAYDAGALLIWFNDRTWAKLCFEYSPDGEAMVVSVVTRGASDDVNSYTVPIHQTWLRISRIEHVYAFHASDDGKRWKLIRAFTMGEDVSAHRVGFVAQSPVGEGCQVNFDEISFSYTTLAELRDGS
jgi:uncharacterized protein